MISQGRRHPVHPTQIAPAVPALHRWIVTTCRDRCNPSHPAARPPASPTTAPSADRTGTSVRISMRHAIRAQEIPRLQHYGNSIGRTFLVVLGGSEIPRISKLYAP